jgi:hypothetical protein
MSFYVYLKQVGDVTVRYERLRPIKLSGPDNPIATCVKSLSAEESGAAWTLSIPTLLRYAGFGADTNDFTILFDVSPRERSSVCLYELRRINGLSADKNTQLALEFLVLMDELVETDTHASKSVLKLPAVGSYRVLTELLELSGGFSGGSWRWMSPKMQLGAARANPVTRLDPGVSLVSVAPSLV